MSEGSEISDPKAVAPDLRYGETLLRRAPQLLKESAG